VGAEKEQGRVDVDYEEPPEVESPPSDGWTVTQTRTSLLPAALLGTAVLLIWRFVGVRFMREGEVESSWLPLLLGGVLPTIFVLVYPVWMIRRAGGRVFDGWPGWQGLLIEAGIAFMALIGVQILNMLLATMYLLINGRGPGIPDQFQELVAGDSVVTLVIMAVLACVWAPIAEEIFFRRFLLRAFTGRFSLAIAIGLQAFIFAILHDYGGMHLGAIFILGLTMGILYAWRKTIVTSMILHMLQNTMAISVLGLFILLNRVGPTLGVAGEPQTDGFRITEVLPHTSASDAKLQVGDVITHVEGNPVEDAMTLRLMYWAAGLDGMADMKIKRGDETLDVHVVPRPAAAALK
jgi:membrane protease YdiL (CAAX protease family)